MGTQANSYSIKCSSNLFEAGIKHSDKKNLWEQRGFFTITCDSPSIMEVWEGTTQELEADSMEECCLLASSHARV